MSNDFALVKYPNRFKVQNPAFLAEQDQEQEGLSFCTEDELNTQVTVVEGRLIKQYVDRYAKDAVTRMYESGHYTILGAGSETTMHAYDYAARYVQLLLRAYAMENAVKLTAAALDEDEVVAPQP